VKNLAELHFKKPAAKEVHHAEPLLMTIRNFPHIPVAAFEFAVYHRAYRPSTLRNKVTILSGGRGTRL
jgi:hypothetical protein